MAIASSDGDDTDNEFEYVASSKVPAGRRVTAGAAPRTGKTVYEEERDARVRAMVKQHGLQVPPPPKEEEEEKEQLQQQPVFAVSDAPDEVQGEDRAAGSRPARDATEEARRLRDQRYAMYRRNRDLNQNALREVDPDTKRYMQIVYTPANNGVRQQQSGRRGGYVGAGR
ncbi:hypothetical protein DQ04_05521000, partial [Trypanosoma grayi]|uniref:hypothetical protein n=1 Tax=Trypanosoma grayi TaxID=71804 RepID=UPI0004F3F147